MKYTRGGKTFHNLEKGMGKKKFVDNRGLTSICLLFGGMLARGALTNIQKPSWFFFIPTVYNRGPKV